MSLPPGKIPIEILSEVVFKTLGVRREEVVLGPSVGFDGAVLNLSDKSLIVSMDPITGAVERIGWLAVHVNANDIATFGVEPAFFSSCILLPENADSQTVEAICAQMDKAARELGVAIIGGHCEVTPSLPAPIVAGCMFGFTEQGNYVTAGGAKPGDKLILTKSAGIEGTAILATDRYDFLLSIGLSDKLLKSAQRFFNQISVVKDGVTAYKTGKVHAMHDPTEGGVLGGAYEMAEASKLGIIIFEEKIPIAEETLQICEAFQIDPLRLISSGAMLISAEPESAEMVIERLNMQGIPASIIGEFTASPKKRIIRRQNGLEETLPPPGRDHLWLALSRKA